MARLTITPWKYSSDLLAVRQQLYRLTEHDERRHAVDRIMAWRLRGNLPHAVESTALLVDAFTHHDNPGNSSFSIRAVYSAAFCRFVTGYCDIGRNKERSLESTSMLEIARQIDMPIDFVALRHEATHEELPSEPRIVDACEHALQWLWRVYWSRLADAAPEISVETLQSLTRQLFKDHRSAMKAQLKKRVLPAVRQTNARNAISTFLDQTAMSRRAAEVVAAEVVDNGMLIPNDRALGDSMDGAFLLWDDLLLVINQQAPSLSCAIIDRMLLTLLADPNDPVAEANRRWLLHFLELDPDLAPHLMKHCILYSTAQTGLLGGEMLAAADDAFRDEWSDLLTVSHAYAGATEIEPASNVAVTKTAVTREQQLNEDVVRWHKMIVAPRMPIGVLQ